LRLSSFGGAVAESEVQMALLANFQHWAAVKITEAG
jgi:hypothetical protein